MDRAARLTLDPVRRAVLAEAHAGASRLLDEATERNAQRLAAARSDAEALVTRQREEAQRLAAADQARQLARVRRESRAVVLGAQREVYEELRERARAAVGALRESARYRDLLERLAREARRQLGEGEPLEVIPVAGGGVIARSGSRSLDYSLGAQVDRCLVELGPQIERLWS